jgi:diadenosine tetraphosphate (Ap4A) HIT family hydrolase
MSDCIFCKNLPKVLENELAYAIYDINPITPGHMLIITKRHHSNIFESTTDEVSAMFDLIRKGKDVLVKKHQPAAFNVQANCGTEAGQVVMHAHVHLIPRYKDEE